MSLHPEPTRGFVVNRNVDIRMRFANRRVLLLCAIGALPCTIFVPSASAADPPASATAPASALGVTPGTPATSATPPRKSQPLNWGALNPQPLPPGPPDPSRSFVSPANAMSQRSVIGGGKPVSGAVPGSSLTPPVSAPAALQLAPVGALGNQGQQRPLTPPPANPLSNRPGVSGPAQPTMLSNSTLSSSAGQQALPGAKGKLSSPAVVASSKKEVKLAPLRASLLKQEAAARDAENVIARSIRLHPTDAANALGFSPSPSGPILITPAGAPPANNATGGAPRALQQTATALRVGKAPLSWEPGAGQARNVPASIAPAIATAEAQRPRMQAVGQNALHLPPGIWFVNNKESGFVVTPGGM